MDGMTEDLRALRLWFRRADDESRNAWLLLVTLLSAFVCAVEALHGLAAAGTSQGMPQGMSQWATLAAFAFCGTLCLAAWRPVSGGLLTVLWWALLCVTPAELPSSMLIGVLLCVGVLGYARRGLGVAVAATAVAVWAFSRGGMTLGGWGAADSGDAVGAAPQSPSPSVPSSAPTAPDVPSGAGHGSSLLGMMTFNGVLPVAALFLGFLIGGIAARWGHDRDAAESELRMRRERERAARTIHDYVSNDLAYVILRLDQDIASGGTVSAAELHELRQAAAKALGHTHEVIALIEGPEDAERAVPRMAPRDAAGVDAEAIAGLRDQCARYEERLRALGFDGQTIVTVQPEARLSTARRELMGGLMEELYTNIGKHADPAYGYVVAVRIAADGIDVAVADTAAHAGAVDPALSAGTGLKRCRERIERLGGTMRVGAGEDGEWSLAAWLPADDGHAG
ncbi:2CS histidine protein kinase [Bifidobacterium sp. DSM 109958]|uniref:2CS histidine protein kinase n=1 Tax=Bifidobacterium moraviense TaxID=2675323 RepID=A0A7Y0F156_9BIFI|nr:hypothetical protein [Bifidobacterium sp. DSM 109958]NMN00118.1 2CS histidine protein kinase [Bifidobacterium sp. DSM 109958]